MNRNKNTMNGKRDGKRTQNKNNRGGKGNKPKSNKPSLKEEEQFFEKKTGNPATRYFSDKELAEQNSYVSSRVILDTRNVIKDTAQYYPNILCYHMNPSASVSKVDPTGIQEGVNPLTQAATKLLTMLVANTGRNKTYSRNDIAMLLLAIGEYISMTEYGRRVFGTYRLFDSMNRDIPAQFFEAQGIDWADFKDNYHDYLSDFNYYIGLGKAIAIPLDKVPYLGKCEEIYQKIYSDGTDVLSCYHMFVPDSTWIIDETADPDGTRLITTPVTAQDHYSFIVPTNGINSSVTGSGITQAHIIRKFSYFLYDVYAPLVERLLTSQTFNDIYADLRSIKFQTAYPCPLWEAETVTYDYKTPIEDASSISSILHNLTLVGRPTGTKDVVGADGVIITKFNDVCSNGNKQSITYNPLIMQGQVTSYKTWDSLADTANSIATTFAQSDPVMDFPEFVPSLDDRVDAMAYMASPRIDDELQWGALKKYLGAINWTLPDHYVTGIYTRITAKLTHLDPLLMGHPMFNAWCPINWANEVVGYGGANVSQNFSSQSVDEWDEENQMWSTDAIPTIDQTQHPAVGRRISLLAMTFVNYIRTAWKPDSNEYVPYYGAGRYYNLSKFVNCDVNNFYVLPQSKLINMFNHTYEHLFTAEDIMDNMSRR